MVLVPDGCSSCNHWRCGCERGCPGRLSSSLQDIVTLMVNLDPGGSRSIVLIAPLDRYGDSPVGAEGSPDAVVSVRVRELAAPSVASHINPSLSPAANMVAARVARRWRVAGLFADAIHSA